MKFILFILFFYCLDVSAQTDTLNRVDADGKKYGYWKVRHKEFYSKKKFNETYLKEEGNYVAGKKDGLWKTYYSDSTLKSEIEYFCNRPNGKFITYHENGKLEESGMWGGAFYYGKFQRFHSNGLLAQEKSYNGRGKADGWFSYYFEDGELDTKMFYKDGIEITDSSYRNLTPNFQFIDDEGSQRNVNFKKYCECEVKKLNAIYFFDFEGYKVELNGKFNSNKLYDGKCNIYCSDTILIESFYYKKGKYLGQFSVKNSAIDCMATSAYPPDGYNKVYTSYGYIEFDGEFKGQKFFNGQKYIYDNVGLLERIELYKEGKYIGDK